MKMRGYRLCWLILLLLAGWTVSLSGQIAITPIGAAEDGGSMGQGRVPDKAIDRSGLSDPGTAGDELDDTHDGVRANQWGANWSTNRTFTLALPEPSMIDRVHLWNAVESTSRGVQSCDISFSTDGGSAYANTTNINFAQGGNMAQTRAFTLRTGVTHVQLSNFVTYDGNSYINIAEIRFGAPAPIGQMYWLDWTASGVTTNVAQLEAVLDGTNAVVTAYWKAGNVTDPSLYVGWDGADGPRTEATGAVARAAKPLAADTRYTYAFYATNAIHATESWSGPSSFVTPFSDAQSPAFSSAAPGFVTVALSWADNASNETSYILQRTPQSGGAYTSFDIGNRTTYVDEIGLQPDTTYTYRLAATNGTNGSATDFALAQTTATTLPIVGDVVADYRFEGTYTSSDDHVGSEASDVTAHGHVATMVSGYYEAESDEIGGYFGNDYLAFTLAVSPGAILSLTALDFHYGAVIPFEFKMGVFADGHQGFGSRDDVIPGSYREAPGPGLDVSQYRIVVDLSVHAGLHMLRGTNVEFRIYMGDGASYGSRFHRFDDIRVYAIDSTLPAATVFSVQ